MSERMAPEKVVQLLNEYFELMVEVIFHNHGTLDKFMGDGLMAIFGAPEDDPYQEQNAIKAAMDLISAKSAPRSARTGRLPLCRGSTGRR